MSSSWMSICLVCLFSAWLGAWGGEGAAPAIDETLAPMTRTMADGHAVTVVKCYPKGLMRAWCVGFDDGNFLPDQRTAESLRKRGLRGTFFLNSLHPQSQEALQHPEIYAGQEVASHGAHHKGFGKMTVEQARSELEQDQTLLGKLFNTTIDGFAYPYGDVPKDGDLQVRHEHLMAELGIIYARKCGATGAFRPPVNFHRWVPDCGLGRSSMKNIDRLLALPADDSVRVLMEFTHPRDVGVEAFPWPVWEAYLDRIAKEPSIWNATYHEFARYVMALRRITMAEGGISNPDTTLTVWVCIAGRPTEILPGRTVPLIAAK